MTIDQYIRQHIDPEGDYLYRLWRATNIHTVHGRMASGHLQGRLLKMLVEMIRPQRILEVGTFSGYSAICLAEGLEDGTRQHQIQQQPGQHRRGFPGQLPRLAQAKSQHHIEEILYNLPKNK